MLTSEDLKRIEHFKGLGVIYTEKDYLQDAILFSLSSLISDELIFKGGTCLYKFYRLDRFSKDLDFHLNRAIDAKKIFEKVLSDLRLVDIHGSIKEIATFSESINVKLSFKGPLYKGNKNQLCFIPINISKRGKLILPVQKDHLTPIYREFGEYELFIMQKEEILAEKVTAIITRDKPRDIYDVWFLLTINVPFDVSLINKKLSQYNKTFSLKEFSQRIEKQEHIWNNDIKNLIFGEIPQFAKIKKEILEKIP